MLETDPQEQIALRTQSRLWDQGPVPDPADCDSFVYANGTVVAPVVGFGTSLTDAAVLQLEKLNEAQRAVFLDLFVGVLKLRMIRVPMGQLAIFPERSYSFLPLERRLPILSETARGYNRPDLRAQVRPSAFFAFSPEDHS